MSSIRGFFSNELVFESDVGDYSLVTRIALLIHSSYR